MLELLKSQIGKIFISILWGLALSLFFKKTCTGNKCVVIQGPPVDEVKTSIYNFDDIKSGTCYKFQPFIKTCDEISQQTVCV